MNLVKMQRIQHTRSLARSVVLAVVVFLVAAFSLAASVVLEKSFTLSPSPSWVVSGAWDERYQSFLLVDVLGTRLIRYSLSGEVLKTYRDAEHFPLPSVIQRVNGGYVVKNEEAEFVWLDEEGRYLRRLNLHSVYSPSQAARLESIYGWTVLNSGILAFGDIEKDSGAAGVGGWKSALVYAPLGSPSSFTILKEVSLADPSRQFYLLGNPYMANAEGKGFFLMMDSSPHIIEFDPDKLQGSNSTLAMRSLHAYLGKRPILPKREGLKTTVSIFETIENSTMPTGLYGSGNRLFILGRANEKGVRSWNLREIDRASGDVTSTLPLITKANHIFLLPGVNRWAMIEKGKVLGAGNQKIEGVQLFRIDR